MNIKHLFAGKKPVTAVFGIRSSYADYYPIGILQNVPEQTLIDNSWTKFYEQTYSTRMGDTGSQLRPVKIAFRL